MTIIFDEEGELFGHIGQVALSFGEHLEFLVVFFVQRSIQAFLLGKKFLEGKKPRFEGIFDLVLYRWCVFIHIADRFEFLNEK